MNRTTSALVTTLCLTTLAGCGSPPKYKQYRELLGDAHTKIQREKYEATEASLLDFLEETSSEQDVYEVQRFFATYLLVDLHQRASFGGGFLTEVNSKASFNVSGSRRGTFQTSDTGHLVATTYFAGKLRALFGKAKKRSTREGDVELLPPPMSTLDAPQALDFANLALLTAYVRLDFEQEAAAIVQSIDALEDGDQAALQFMEDARVPPSAPPWILYAAHVRNRDVEVRKAYRYGILARRYARATETSFGSVPSDRIVDWVLGHPKWEFVSSGNQPFLPTITECPESGDDVLDFQPRSKRRDE